MDEFEKTKRTKLVRAAQRGHYDHKTVHAILDEALICHVGTVIDGKPAVIPTAHWRQDNRLYIHGSKASRMLRAAQGSEVCIAVSLMDGLVMARSGFHHSINYRSVIVYGVADLVEDAAEKLDALELFMEKIAPGRWPELRPATDKEIKSTTVLAVDLKEVSAKIRTGPPVDDEPDYALPIWAGVVPTRLTLGEPIADPRLAEGVEIPAYLLPEAS
ncbi:MAG: pyridoxamine 5'-phosphate oxidase family protein [Rhodospirillales bacterium]|jgi:hypothetical protein|nr:pyridoxamine 5'-phosphate oxidase family protein [Rhodospirillales bacterium]